MTWLKNLKSGDSVFLVTSSRHRGNRVIQIEKVGRKWVTLSENEGRLDINQELRKGGARVDQSYGSPDLVYSSQEAYEHSVKAMNLRKAVYAAVVTHGDLTDEQIQKIAELIGISESEPS